MDPLKEAFQKIKEEMNLLHNEIFMLKNEITRLSSQTNPTQNPTQEEVFINTPTQNPTLPQEIRGLSTLNYGTSTGNKGVPTDTPTNQQTHQQTDKSLILNEYDEIDKAKEALDSLDNIKKALRIKFKRLTQQEMLVFSTIYNLEAMLIDEISYKLVANNLNLSESSIRDYTNKLIKKGIPLKKKRLNNKTIALSISPDLKRIATLPTIMKLREL
jgi:archaellum component FlaC